MDNVASCSDGSERSPRVNVVLVVAVVVVVAGAFVVDGAFVVGRLS